MDVKVLLLDQITGSENLLQLDNALEASQRERGGSPGGVGLSQHLATRLGLYEDTDGFYPYIAPPPPSLSVSLYLDKKGKMYFPRSTYKKFFSYQSLVFVSLWNFINNN